MSIPTITKEQIEEAIRQAMLAKFVRPPNTFTAVELGDILEMSADSAKRRGEQMVELGLATPIKVKTIDKRGNLIDVPAFTLKIPL